MISLYLMLVIISLLVLLTEIAATALKLTGLNIHTARFQALSAITGTGFTTKETETIMDHKQRRNIIMALMIIGPICFLGMLSSLFLSLRQHLLVSNLAFVLLFVLCLLILARSRRFVVFFHRQIEKQLKRYNYPRRVQLEEILQLGSDYGIYELKVAPTSKFVSKTLQETDFKDRGFIVLAIERPGELLTVPKGHDVILAEDILVIFGQLSGIKSIINE